MTDYGAVLRDTTATPTLPLARIVSFTAPVAHNDYGTVLRATSPPPALARIATYALAGTIAPAAPPLWGQLWPRGDYKPS